MPNPAAREALEDFRCWLVETCDHIRHAGELLGPTHGPGDLMLFERSNGVQLTIDEVEKRLAALKDSKAECGPVPLQDAIAEAARSQLDFINQNRDEFLKAWLCKTGVQDPTKVEMIETVDTSEPGKLVTRISFRTLEEADDDPNPESETP
jgi:hypothetical protein